MPGSLVHSPADILRYLLIQEGLGTNPDDSGSWPIYSDGEPTLPDNCITIYNTAGETQGRLMQTGELQVFDGIQIRIRSTSPHVGFTKAQAIAIALDATIYKDSVAISTSIYLVWSVSRKGTVLPLGKDGKTSRNLFTINAVMSVRQTT